MQDTYGPLLHDLAARQAARVSSQVDAAKARAADLSTAVAEVPPPLRPPCSPYSREEVGVPPPPRLACAVSPCMHPFKQPYTAGVTDGGRAAERQCCFHAPGLVAVQADAAAQQAQRATAAAEKRADAAEGRANEACRRAEESRVVERATAARVATLESELQAAGARRVRTPPLTPCSVGGCCSTPNFPLSTRDC